MNFSKSCVALSLSLATVLWIGSSASSVPVNAAVPAAAPSIATTAFVPVGVWKLSSFYREDVKTRERRIYFGTHPNGYLLITDRWFTACITGDRRSKPIGNVATNDEKLALYNSLIAYIGPYVLDRNKMTIHVKASWNQSWSGSNQIRFVSFDGHLLSIKTAPFNDWLDGKLSTYVLTFRRAQ
jgi:hypothetical protein